MGDPVQCVAWVVYIKNSFIGWRTDSEYFIDPRGNCFVTDTENINMKDWKYKVQILKRVKQRHTKCNVKLK